VSPLLPVPPVDSSVGASVDTRSKLGSTELAEISTCERLYYFKHILKLPALIERLGALLGSLLHICTRYWYAQFLPNGPPPWWYVRTLEEELHRVGVGHPDLILRAEIIFAHYLAQYAEEDRAWKVLAVEEEFEIDLDTLFEGVPLTKLIERDYTRIVQLCQEADEPLPKPSKRSDLMLERSDGVQFELDFKSTAGQYGKLPIWSSTNEWAIAWQPMQYLFIGRRLRKPDGTFRFPRLRSFLVQRLKTSEPIRFDRNEIEMCDAAYNETPVITMRQLRKRAELRADARAGMFDRDGPVGSYWACENRYGKCDYYPICHSNDRVGMIERAREKVR